MVVVFKMKVKIKSFNGVLPEYLTIDKEYEVHDVVTVSNQEFFNIIADNGSMVSVCHHDLNGGSWEVIEK